MRTAREDKAGAAGNKPVTGLLRASIRSGRQLIREGDSIAVRVAPRGVRVHLYSQRIEALHGYMRAGHEAAAAQLGEIARRAWARTTTGRR